MSKFILAFSKIQQTDEPTANEPEGAVFKMEGFVSGSTYDNADTANGYYKMVEDPETGTYYKHISESWYIFSEQFSSNGYWVLHSAYSPTLNNFPDMWRRRTILGGLTHPFSLSGVEWTNPTKAVPSPDGDGSMVYSPEGIATSINAEN